jgi:hypothetical protein
MKIVGTNELIKNLQAAGPRGVKAVGCGLYLMGNNVLSEAKKECPVDTGIMKNSGYVTLPQVSGNNVVVECGFGGASKAYVVRQHEDVTLNHPGGGNAKFLQNPLYRAKGSLGKNVANYAERAFVQNQGASPTDMPQKPR